MKLYIYEHCPFCVRARMIFGLKNVPVEQQVLLSDDFATPERMIGEKMAPILRNLTCVKSLTFPLKIKAYIQSMASLSKVDLFFDKAI